MRISTQEATVQFTGCTAAVERVYSLWQKRHFRRGEVRVTLLLAPQELFQGDGAAREKGQSYLV